MTTKAPNVAPPRQDAGLYSMGRGEELFGSYEKSSPATPQYQYQHHKHSSSSITYVDNAGETEFTPLYRYDPHRVDWTKDESNQPPPTWLERKLGLPSPLIWLLFHSIVSICWGIALAVFMSGVVTITFRFSEAVIEAGEAHDFDYANEMIGLVGSLATMHVTGVLQRAVAEYAQIVLAGEFTLRELRWMQGVNEMSLTVEFPPGRGGDGWMGKVVRWLTPLRVSWYVIYFGVTLHTMSIVAIMSPQLKIQHVEFNDPIPCGVEAAAVSLEPDALLSGSQQEVLDKLSFDVGMQLASYIDQVNGNTTTSLAGRKYRREPYAYGAVGGLVEGLQETPGVQYTAECVDGRDVTRSTEIWQSVLPGLSLPTVAEPWTGFTEAPAPIPSSHGRFVSDPSLNFSISLTEAAMYGVVDPRGNGALMGVSRGRTLADPLRIVCVWRTMPKLIVTQHVNFTSLALEVHNSTLWPLLSGRATLWTAQGMAAAARFGASVDPIVNRALRTELLRSDMGGAPPTQVLEYLLADGTKAAITAYNNHWGRVLDKNAVNPPPGPAMCNSKNKTVAEHYRFGNDKHLGWIAVVWTIGIGIVGVVLTFWMRKKRSARMDLSPLDAMGGFMLGRGGVIGDEQKLRVVDGKVVDVPGPMKL